MLMMLGTQNTLFYLIVQDASACMMRASPSTMGVYMGCVWQEYPALMDALHVPSSAQVLTGSGMNFMVGRVSYTFGLQGGQDYECALAGSVIHAGPCQKMLP